MNNKAIIAMSGGVDSSVAYALEIPYHVFNFSARFKEDVIDRFIAACENGMTLNRNTFSDPKNKKLGFALLTEQIRALLY